MSLHTYRARCAESRAEHEVRMYLMAEDKRALALRSGRHTRRDGRCLRDAVRARDEATRHWLAAVVELLSWLATTPREPPTT